MGEPCLRAFEAGVGDQLHTAQHPDLPANMRLGSSFSADTKAEHFGKEAHIPVNVFHLDSDVFNIGARETHRFQALPGYSVRANSMPLTQATMVELTGVGIPTLAPQRMTEPWMKSTSVAPPACRLCSIEVLNSAGSPADAIFHATRGSVIEIATPAALATAIPSATAANAASSSTGRA